MKPNKKFELEVEDIELIEYSLRLYMAKFKDETTDCTNLLAKLHHAKVWYRPKNKPYISG